MKIETLVLGLIAIVLLIGLTTSLAYSASLAGDIDGYKEDVKQYSRDLNDLRNSSNYWRNLYEDFEPKIVYDNNTIYVNTTEYIYETIYLGNRIYDVNRDGTIDYLDACEVLWYINHDPRWIQLKYHEIYGNCWKKLYDVNIDGIVNISDVDDIWLNCD